MQNMDMTGAQLLPYEIASCLAKEVFYTEQIEMISLIVKIYIYTCQARKSVALYTKMSSIK